MSDTSTSASGAGAATTPARRAPRAGTSAHATPDAPHASAPRGVALAEAGGVTQGPAVADGAPHTPLERRVAHAERHGHGGDGEAHHRVDRHGGGLGAGGEEAHRRDDESGGRDSNGEAGARASQIVSVHAQVATASDMPPADAETRAAVAEAMASAAMLAARGQRRPPLLTVELAAQFFHMPVDRAAKTLGICVAHFKRRCRVLRMPKWPYRRARALSALLGRPDSVWTLRKRKMLYKLLYFRDVQMRDVARTSIDDLVALLRTRARQIQPLRRGVSPSQLLSSASSSDDDTYDGGDGNADGDGDADADGTRPHARERAAASSSVSAQSAHARPLRHYYDESAPQPGAPTRRQFILHMFGLSEPRRAAAPLAVPAPTSHVGGAPAPPALAAATARRAAPAPPAAVGSLAPERSVASTSTQSPYAQAHPQLGAQPWMLPHAALSTAPPEHRHAQFQPPPPPPQPSQHTIPYFALSALSAPTQPPAPPSSNRSPPQQQQQAPYPKDALPSQWPQILVAPSTQSVVTSSGVMTASSRAEAAPPLSAHAPASAASYMPSGAYLATSLVPRGYTPTAPAGVMTGLVVPHPSSSSHMTVSVTASPPSIATHSIGRAPVSVLATLREAGIVPDWVLKPPPLDDETHFLVRRFHEFAGAQRLLSM